MCVHPDIPARSTPMAVRQNLREAWFFLSVTFSCSGIFSDFFRIFSRIVISFFQGANSQKGICGKILCSSNFRFVSYLCGARKIT